MISAIIQARVGSTRLKNKTLLDLRGFKLIEWILYRVKLSNEIDNFILAIPDSRENDVLADYGEKYKYQIFRGSEEDVVARYFYAAKNANSSVIVRVCADNPFVSHSELDKLISFFNEDECDYAYNHVPEGNNYPDGLGGEIVSFDTLELINREAKLPGHREHVFNYIWDNPEKFTIRTFDPDDSRLHHPELKLDIDTMEDYLRLKNLPVERSMPIREIVGIAVADQRERKNEIKKLN